MSIWPSVRGRQAVARPNPTKARVRLELLERRLLLSVDDTAAITQHEADDAQHAANADFDGPDGTGKDGPMAKTGMDLDLLYEQLKIHNVFSPGTAFTPSNSLLVVSGDDVLVDVSASGDVATFRSQVTALGMNVSDASGSLLEGMLPISALPQLASLGTLNFARASYRPITATGAVESQGDIGLQANVARTTFGVDGSGQTVGILSDSFNRFPYSNGVSGLQQDITTGDLPQQTSILQDSLIGEDEGRAMGQIVHDVAPGAAIQFATAEGGKAHFAANIQRLAAAGSTVIVDDVGYLTEPFFQDGMAAQAVDSVVAAGVPYFSAAGNEGNASYEAPFRDSGVTGLRGGKLQDFDPGPGVSTLQQITVPVGASFTPSFQWDQPFKSLGGAGSLSDLDIYLIGSDGTKVLASSVTNNVGGDPLELFSFTNDGSFDLDKDGVPDTKFNVEIELVSGPAPGLMKYVDFGRAATIDTFATNSSTDIGHSNAAGALGVAASAFFFTPAFGQTPPVLNSFSSNGGTQTLFDPSGNRLAAPVIHGSPQVTGIDGGNTTFFGQDVPQDGDSLPNFFGTSAAAPHVAAIAALMLQAAGGAGSLAPQTVYSALETSGIDITGREDAFSPGTVIPIANGTGLDTYSGHGLVNAPVAVQLAGERVSVADVTMLEGDSGITNFVFTVSLATPVSLPVTVRYTTVDDTATSPSDYISRAGTLTFVPGGPVQQTIVIQVNGDTTVEADERFLLNLSNPTNAILGRATAVGTILNDDLDLSVSDASVVEGNSGTRDMVFAISAVGRLQQNVTVSYTTTSGTASAGVDFVPRSGTVTFPPTGGVALITVPVIGDTLNEGNEFFTLDLFNALAGHIAKGSGVGTIIDDDRNSALYVNDVHVTASQAGLVNAIFSVALDQASAQFVTVQYTTSDGTAKAAANYLATSGTVTFAPGVTSQLVTVPVLTAGAYAPNEQFNLNLFNPLHAAIVDPVGVGTIIFGTPPPTEAIVDDGDATYGQTNGWTRFGNSLSYGLDYEMHPAAADGGFADWSFSGLPVGSYQVFTKWIPGANRATNALYTIYDGSTPVGNAQVNQQLMPAGDQSNGVVWQSLGVFNASTGMLDVRLGDNANGNVVADAIRIVSGGIGPQAAEMDVSGVGQSIVDSVLGGAAVPAENNGTDFGIVPAFTNSIIDAFTITNTGNADLHLTGAIPVSLSGANASDFTLMNQPPATIAPGTSATFQIMFHPSVVGMRTAEVTIPSDDAAKGPYTFSIQGTGVDAGPTQLLVDDSGSGYQQQGAWSAHLNSTSSLGQFHSDPGGQGSDWTTWNFANLAPGNYSVYTTYVAAGNRATNAPFTLTDGGTQRTVPVNEQVAPADASYNGVQWKSLGSLSLASGRLTVSLSNQANGLVVADAVYLVRNDVPSAGATGGAATTNSSSSLANTSTTPSSPNAIHNSVQPLDVNGDGAVSALDALLLIEGLGSAGPSPAGNFLMDVNGDGAVSPVDLLMVIASLRTAGPQSAVAPQAVPASVTAGDAAPSATASSVATAVVAATSAPAAVASPSASPLSASAVDAAFSQLTSTPSLASTTTAAKSAAAVASVPLVKKSSASSKSGCLLDAQDS